MKKTASHAIFKRKLFEQQFKLPENFHKRVESLEYDLEMGKLSELGLKDLIDLYSVIKFYNYLLWLMFN